MSCQLKLYLTIFTIITRNYVSSENCVVTNEAPLFSYNFNQLSNSDVKVFNSTTNETITLRLCSPLEKMCGGRAGYSICLRKDGKETGVGTSLPKIKNDGHTVNFNFTGDPCEGDINYSVQIVMKCNYTATGPSTPILLADRKNHCELQMIWNTEFACITPTKTSCSIDHNDNHFDLSSLQKSSGNHVVFLNNQPKMKMLLNVCHSIIHEDGANCARKEVGACLVNISNANDLKYISYGEITKKGLYFENDILKIQYLHGDRCVDDSLSLEEHQTTISFICDPQAMIDTIPEYSNDSKPCDFKFTWRTAAACNKTYLNQYTKRNANRCTVRDPERNFTIDLQTLMNQDFTVNTSDNTQYKFRICGSTTTGGCDVGTGICNTKNSASAGMANSNLMWQHGGSYLNYTDGVACGNGQKRYTLITFVCGAENSNSLPIILKDEPCYLIIHWYTELACNGRITCAQNEINLGQFIRNDKNYVVNALGTEFHINICRPVVPTPNLACPPGSAVCQVVKNSRGQYTKETSLGFPDQNPVLDGDQNLILNYYRGSPCLENPTKNISSTFKFICDYKGDMGLPVYKEYSNCHYIFEWRTNIVCGAVVGKWSSPCTVKDPSHPFELDLSALYPKPIPRFVSAEEKNYSINICGRKEHCNGSAVCQGINGYGRFSHVTFDYRSQLIKLQYSNGTNCSKESFVSEISLICNITAGIGDPVLKMHSNCSAFFKWQTMVACPWRAHDVVVTSQPLPTTEKSSVNKPEDYTSMQTWIISCTIILVLLVVGLFLYLRNPRMCVHLRSRISAITATKNHSRVQYSRVCTPTDITARHVNTTEEARLLLDASDPCTDGHIDSDDELLGV